MWDRGIGGHNNPLAGAHLMGRQWSGGEDIEGGRRWARHYRIEVGWDAVGWVGLCDEGGSVDVEI